MKRINIKDSVRNNVTGIGNFHNQSFETIAKVIECSEKSNVCTINYLDTEDKPQIKVGVPIMLSDPNNIGWYPKANDYVVIKLNGTEPIIIGDAMHLLFKNKGKENAMSETNIFSSINDSIGGYLI